MIARLSRCLVFLKITQFIVTFFWVFALMPLLAVEKNRLEGPSGAKFAFGDEFDGAIVNDAMWDLGINQKNLQNKILVTRAVMRNKDIIWSGLKKKISSKFTEYTIQFFR